MAETRADLALWYNTNDSIVGEGDQLALKHGVKVRTYQIEASDPEVVRNS